MQVLSPPRPVAPGRGVPAGVLEAAGVLVGVGLGVSVTVPIVDSSASALRLAGGWATLVGNVAAMGGSYLLVVMVVLAARLPVLERVAGADTLLAWHRRLAKWPMVALSVHVGATTIGYAQGARTGLWAQLGRFIDTFPDLLAAVVGYGLLVVVAVGSIRAARRTMSYETWWAIHLYTYLALALSFAHEIVDGTDLVGHRLQRAGWIVLWAGTVGVVAVYRIATPIYRNLGMGLRVHKVTKERPGVVSIVVSGRNLDRLAAQGGQFFWWRFGTRDLWWQAHPFSISAPVTDDRMRVTVAVRGDATAALARLSPGTRVFVEGPYGAFTAERRSADKVLLVGAGVGMTPIRALLEDLPAGVDVTVVARARSRAHLVFAEEIAALVAARGGRVVEAFGRRHNVTMTASNLARTVPDVAERDVYVCGPNDFADDVEAAALACGVPGTAIHRERFTL